MKIGKQIQICREVKFSFHQEQTVEKKKTSHTTMYSETDSYSGGHFNLLTISNPALTPIQKVKLIALGTDYLICIFTTCDFITLSPSSWTILSLLILTYSHGKGRSSIISRYVWLTLPKVYVSIYIFTIA